jgi:hypothetical protein
MDMNVPALPPAMEAAAVTRTALGLLWQQQQRLPPPL